MTITGYYKNGKFYGTYEGPECCFDFTAQPDNNEEVHPEMMLVEFDTTPINEDGELTTFDLKGTAFLEELCQVFNDAFALYVYKGAEE